MRLQRSATERSLRAMCGIAGYSLSSDSSVDRTVAARALLAGISVPPEARQLLVHVRDYTKGHPSLSANNHPIRHGAVVGVHNGVIVNDDELFAHHGIARDEAGMTVDSEIIFALAERSRGRTAEA